MRSLAKLLRGLANFCAATQNFFIFCTHVTMAYKRSPDGTREYNFPLCVASQNFCVASQNFLRGLAKLLRSHAKLLRGLAKLLRSLAKVLRSHAKLLRGHAKPSVTRIFVTVCTVLNMSDDADALREFLSKRDVRGELIDRLLEEKVR